MPDIEARHVVIGAGAMGAATAYHLARRGEPVVLIEQFDLGHDRGSSHGAARITRYSYADPHYAQQMPAAFQAWRELEADAGVPLYLRTGGVSLCPPEVDYVGQVTANLAALGIAHRRMTGRELNRAIPVFGVPDDHDVVFEPDAGMLAAARIVQAEIALAQQFGGPNTQVIPNCRVRAIDLDGRQPVVHTDSGRIRAERLVVTAGAWVRSLIPDLPFDTQPTRQQVVYLVPPESATAAYGPGSLPIFIAMGTSPDAAFYGMPTYAGMGVKVARHGGPETDPELPDLVVSEEYRSIVRQFLRGCLPNLSEQPVERTEICLYTMIPGEEFRLGLLPGHPGVLVASPCSGHGFKFSCLIGKILAEWAVQGESKISPDAWSLTRLASRNG